MLRTALRRLPSKARALTVVVLLGAVVTAGAPNVIRVHSGDTLSEIAQRHHTSVRVLRQLNDLPGNGTIYAGQTLRLPGSARGGASGRGEGGYTVRAGDTLSEIAKRFGVSTSSIRTRNRLPASGLVRIGQRLAIPGAGARSSGSSSAGIPSSVSSSASTNRALLRSRPQPSKAAVRRMVAQTARRHGVSPSLALAVAYHESGFQQRVVSGVNAIGVMQVLPSTGRVLSQQHGRRLDLLKAQDNVTAGVLLLRQLLRSTGSERMTLAGYYQGLGSISRQGLLPQTHSYIRSIGYLRPRFARG
ncbi:MAG: Peptidoglycan-binding LysM [Frankiales bacterium]|nr:Peptidoglycan-binding LysM [Frankiales bacterium]